jgi:hypothetical protein
LRHAAHNTAARIAASICAVDAAAKACGFGWRFGFGICCGR